MANTKLLLVEDDENLAYMEKSCFEDIIGGYEVKTAVNGKEGLKVWQDFQPDVIYRHAHHGRNRNGEENTRG